MPQISFMSLKKANWLGFQGVQPGLVDI